MWLISWNDTDPELPIAQPTVVSTHPIPTAISLTHYQTPPPNRLIQILNIYYILPGKWALQVELKQHFIIVLPQNLTFKNKLYQQLT